MCVCVCVCVNEQEGIRGHLRLKSVSRVYNCIEIRLPVLQSVNQSKQDHSDRMTASVLKKNQ